MNKALMQDIISCKNTEAVLKELDSMTEIEAWYYLRGLKDINKSAEYFNFVETTKPEKAIFHKIIGCLLFDDELKQKYIMLEKNKDPEIMENLQHYKDYYKSLTV